MSLQDSKASPCPEWCSVSLRRLLVLLFRSATHAFSLRTLLLDRVNSTAIKAVHTNYNNQTTQLTMNRLPAAENLVIDSSSAPRRVQAKSRKRRSRSRTRMTTTTSGKGCQSTSRGVSTPFEKSDKIRTGRGKRGKVSAEMLLPTVRWRVMSLPSRRKNPGDQAVPTQLKFLTKWLILTKRASAKRIIIFKVRCNWRIKNLRRNLIHLNKTTIESNEKKNQNKQE